MGSKITVYSGKIRKREASGGGGHTPEWDGGNDTDQIGQAQIDAEEIIAEAYREARDIVARKSAELEQDYEFRLAQRLTETFSETHLGLHDATEIIADIVTVAIRKIIGDSKAAENILGAVQHAISEYEDRHTLRVIVSPKDYPRLSVLMKSAEMVNELKGVRLLQDSSFAPGQCVLDTGEQRFNIGVDAQIAVLRQRIEKNGHVLEWADSEDTMQDSDETDSDTP